MSQNRNDKRSIRYRQFVDGYAQALDTQLRAVLEGYRLGHFGRNEVRVFAGQLEQTALHKNSSVSLYFMRRIPQRKPMQRLMPNEHYARFRYAEFEDWTGVHRATQSRILQRLIARGYLNTAPVHKQNENCYGQLFIDGPMISLVRPRQAARHRPRPNSSACEKKSTPPKDLINTPTEKRSTLRNLNPKTEIQEREKLASSLKEGFLGRHRDPGLQRIAERAAQMLDEASFQAA